MGNSVSGDGQLLRLGTIPAGRLVEATTYYAVTNRRVLVLQEGWRRKTSMMFLDEIPQIEKEGTSAGTLWFGVKYPVVAPRRQKTRDVSRFSLGDVPVFADIAEVDSVYRLILGLRTKITQKPFSEGPLTYSPSR